jgi:hypothetical protein
MARTTAAAVKELLDRNYDTRNVPSLEGFIATANLIVTKVAECAARRSVTLADDHLELMERWLEGQPRVPVQDDGRAKRLVRAQPGVAGAVPQRGDGPGHDGVPGGAAVGAEAGGV